MNKFLAVIAEAYKDGLLTKEAADAVRDLWEVLVCAFGKGVIPLPKAGVTNDKGYQMVWDSGEVQLVVDVMADGKYEWFSYTRYNKMIDGNDNLDLAGIFTDLTKELRNV